MCQFRSLVLTHSQAAGVDTQVGVPAHAVVQPALVPLLVLARLHEELDLHHLELPGAEDEVSGGDLVPEGLAYLGNAERQFLAGGIKNILEVDEDTLGRLRPQVGHGRVVLDRTNECLEHEVEVAGFRELAAARRTLVLLQLVVAPALVAGLAVHQRVGEILDVAAGPPDVGVHQNGCVQAYHVVAFPHEGPPPGVLYIALQLNTKGAIVPRAGEPSVNLAALKHEASALGQGHYLIQLYR